MTLGSRSVSKPTVRTHSTGGWVGPRPIRTERSEEKSAPFRAQDRTQTVVKLSAAWDTCPTFYYRPSSNSLLHLKKVIIKPSSHNLSWGNERTKIFIFILNTFGGGRRLIGISGSLILSKILLEMTFNPCDEFRWSPEGPVSQIHSSHLTLVPLDISDLLRSVQMVKREWGAESNGKLPYLFIPSKTATLVPEFAVEDLPSRRTAILIPAFAVKDLLLGRTLWWWCLLRLLIISSQSLVLQSNTNIFDNVFFYENILKDTLLH